MHGPHHVAHRLSIRTLSFRCVLETVLPSIVASDNWFIKEPPAVPLSEQANRETRRIPKRKYGLFTILTNGFGFNETQYYH